MILKKIKAKNFLTYEDLEYDFVNKPLMIQGINETDDKQRSNGSGKSSIQTMVEFSITGDNSRGVRNNELVRFGCKESFLDLHIYCDVRKEELHISWNIKLKGSNQLTLKINKEDKGYKDVVFSNVNDGKKWIIEWLGISKNDIFNYFIINKTRFKSFFKSSNKEKVELINRFSDASIIDKIDEIDISENELKYDGLRSDISKCEGKLQLLEENLYKELNRDLDNEYNESIEEYEESNKEIVQEISEIEGGIEELKGQIQSTETDLQTCTQIKESLLDEELHLESGIEAFNKSFEPLNKQLLEAQKLVDEFSKPNFEKLKEVQENKIQTIEDNIESVEQKVNKNKEQQEKALMVLSKLNVKLSGTITCPSCSHKFIQDTETPLETVLANKTKVEGLKTVLEKSNTKYISEIKTLKTTLELPELELFKISESEKESSKELQLLVNSVTGINLNINKKNKELSLLKEGVYKLKSKTAFQDNKEATYKSKLIQIEQQIKNLKSDIKNCKKDIDSNNNFIKSLSKIDNTKIIEGLKKDLESVRGSKLKKELELTEVENDIHKLNEWKNNFKQFKMHIANLSLDTMEYHCNRYLNGMGSDLKVNFEGFKVLADGTIKDEITANIVRDCERTFSSFSGGEQGRLLFASILANRHMINMTHPYGGLQFLSIDEVFEGVDSLGLASLVEEAGKLQECIMIISHVTDENIHCDNLMVVKRGGISKIN